MGVKELIIVVLTLGIFGVAQAQYYGRMRGLNSLHKDCCTCTCEDLSSLIALARALEEKETCQAPPPPPPQQTTSCLSNFEELIMKLVNALVYTTTETTKNTYRCPHYGHGHEYEHGHGHGHGHSSNHHNSHSDGGLLDIDLLNPNKNDNLLDVDLANQHLVGVGLGGNGRDSGSSGPTNSKNNGHHQMDPKSNDNSDNGLVNLDLLNPHKSDNVADLDLGKQKVLGVGLGGGGSPVPGPKNNDNHKNSQPKSGEGLVNLDLLNPHKKNNVADLDLVGKNLVGVGL